MRIGISAPHRAATPRSGVGRYVEGLVGSLLAIDRDNEYFLITDAPYLKTLPPNARWETVPTTGRLGRLLWDHRGIRKAAARWGLDILLATKTVLPRALPCRGMATVHDLAFMRHPQQYPWDFRFYWNRVMRALAESEHGFVCVSETTAADVRELLGVPAARVHAVPSGIDASRFAVPPKERLRARLSELGLQGRYILFVGNLIPRKNVRRLLEAFRTVRAEAGVDLVLAGADLMGLPPAEGVRRFGELADDDLACLYAGAAALAFPSLYEGFGFPILEAMACGCPVVTSDRGSMREIGGEAVLGVNPESVPSIAGGLLSVVTDARAAEALRAAGRSRVKQFSWEQTARATLAVLTARA